MLKVSEKISGSSLVNRIELDYKILMIAKLFIPKINFGGANKTL